MISPAPTEGVDAQQAPRVVAIFPDDLVWQDFRRSTHVPFLPSGMYSATLGVARARPEDIDVPPSRDEKPASEAGGIGETG